MHLSEFFVTQASLLACLLAYLPVSVDRKQPVSELTRILSWSKRIEKRMVMMRCGGSWCFRSTKTPSVLPSFLSSLLVHTYRVHTKQGRSKLQLSQSPPRSKLATVVENENSRAVSFLSLIGRGFFATQVTLEQDEKSFHFCPWLSISRSLNEDVGFVACFFNSVVVASSTALALNLIS